MSRPREPSDPYVMEELLALAQKQEIESESVRQPGKHTHTIKYHEPQLNRKERRIQAKMARKSR